MSLQRVRYLGWTDDATITGVELIPCRCPVQAWTAACSLDEPALDQALPREARLLAVLQVDDVPLLELQGRQAGRGGWEAGQQARQTEGAGRGGAASECCAADLRVARAALQVPSCSSSRREPAEGRSCTNVSTAPRQGAGQQRVQPRCPAASCAACLDRLVFHNEERPAAPPVVCVQSQLLQRGRAGQGRHGSKV